LLYLVLAHGAVFCGGPVMPAVTLYLAFDLLY
jgi:hypothetical protein